MTPPSPLSNESLTAPTPPAAPNVPVAAELPPPLPQLAEGLIPAVLIPPITEEALQIPEVESIIANFEQIYQLGLETYEAGDMSTVVFNPSLVSAEQLTEAEGNGTLAQLAMPLLGDGALAGEMAAPAPAPAPAQPLAGAGLSPTSRANNMQPPQVSPIQPDPITSQLARRAV